MPHQWMEGNVPVSAKCAVCDKTCGSVLRLQDLRCLWCRAMVSNSSRKQRISPKDKFPFVFKESTQLDKMTMYSWY